jgi:hypothetical protein
MKKLKLIPILAISATLSFLSGQSVKAEGCSDYPYVAMQTKFIPKENGLFSLQVTQQQSVRADSTSQMDRALKIAELKGRQSISKFIKEEIAEKDSFDNESIENAVENPDGVDWSIEEAGSMLQSISSSSKNLVRGILPIGSCYEPGKFVRVTLGIKPETILAAGNVDASSRNPYSGFSNKTNSSNPSNNSPEDGTSSPGRAMQPFNTAPGYSGIDPDF